MFEEHFGGNTGRVLVTVTYDETQRRVAVDQAGPGGDAAFCEVLERAFQLESGQVRDYGLLEYADVVLPIRVRLLDHGLHYRLVLSSASPQPLPRRMDEQSLHELASEWEVYGTDDGKSYYHHRPTGRTTWKKPAALQLGESDGGDDDPWEDEAYFQSYDTMAIHRVMVGDRPRSDAYRAALQRMRPHIEGKVVLDVGCGTGLLSLFAAEAGAAKVVAIEASGMADVAEQVIQRSKYSSVIQLVRGRAETVPLPFTEEVSVVVSEWMGSLLVFESMLESVLAVRDRVAAAQNGRVPLLLPSYGELFVGPIQVDSYWKDHVDFWRDVYGFDYEPARQRVLDGLSRPVWDEALTEAAELAPAQSFARLEMAALSTSDLERIEGDVTWTVARDGILHGLAVWFTVGFAADGCETLVLSTAPGEPATHWKQDLLLLREPVPVAAGDNFECSIALIRHPQFRRHYNIDVLLSRDNSIIADLTFDRWHPKDDFE